MSRGGYSLRQPATILHSFRVDDDSILAPFHFNPLHYSVMIAIERVRQPQNSPKL